MEFVVEKAVLSKNADRPESPIVFRVPPRGPSQELLGLLWLLAENMFDERLPLLEGQRIEDIRDCRGVGAISQCLRELLADRVE